MRFTFNKLLQKDGWLDRARVTTDEEGVIVSIEEAAADGEGEGIALPGFHNAHSHAFQYAMAGLAERHTGESDFWSWREAMYRLALSVTPDQLEAIAGWLYAEMLRHGYTQVAEFHYLHHDPEGRPYADPAETGVRLIRAAERAGIGLTLIPIFYQKGGFGQEPAPEQRRFISSTIEDYHKLFEASAAACRGSGHASVAVGIHSLRGVEPAAVKEVAASFPRDVPFHIHVSEQKKEVADCLEALGRRPVEWMLENLGLSDRFSFVHATHLVEEEIEGLAETGTNVVLCPTTEGNLGDGLFPLREFQEAGGRWCLGTDSHVSLNPFEELRLLDYGQRLVTHRRDTFYDGSGGGSGAYAVRQAVLTGRRSTGAGASDEYFAVGDRFDACVFDADHPLIRSASDENLLDTLVYASDETMQTGVIAGGRWRVQNGRHVERDSLAEGFLKAVGELSNR